MLCNCPEKSVLQNSSPAQCREAWNEENQRSERDQGCDQDESYRGKLEINQVSAIVQYLLAPGSSDDGGRGKCDRSKGRRGEAEEAQTTVLIRMRWHEP